MAVSIAPESGSFPDTSLAQGATKSGITIRKQCERLRGQLDLEKATFLSHWKELADHILPRRARFQLTDVNKGDRRTQKIIDSTATEAVGTCSAGIMSSVTSPARPWFKLTVPNPEISEQEDVKEWLHDVEQILGTIFLRSNLYDILPVIYADMAVFGTSAMAVMEDDEDVIRCYEYPIGSYAVGNDSKLRVRTWVRTFRYSVAQMVDRWGNIDKNGLADFQAGRPSTLSKSVQQMWIANSLAAWIDVVHVIRPNASYDGNKIDAKYKKYESIYYEMGNQANQGEANNYGLLEHGGFDEFPVLCLRWEVNSEDVYGTNCPGMRALGDIRQLQLQEKRSAQANEKLINPPMTGPSRLMNVKVSTIPGDITYDDARDGQAGFRPTYQIKYDIAGNEAKSEQIRNRIKRVFYADLFLMISESDRRQVTATEIDERKEEKLLALGPMLQRIDKDGLSPLIDRTFNIAARKGLIPPAPDALQGQALRVEYVSIMALAQKRVGIEGLERTLSFVGQAMQVSPDSGDGVDFDELIRQHADSMGTPPKILKPQDQIDQLRQQRAQQQQMQQAAANAPGVAGAVKDLSQSPTDGNSALAALLGKKNASATLNATSRPPQSLVA
jgi:hypothetical protein